MCSILDKMNTAVFAQAVKGVQIAGGSCKVNGNYRTGTRGYFFHNGSCINLKSVPVNICKDRNCAAEFNVIYG